MTYRIIKKENDQGHSFSIHRVEFDERGNIKVIKNDPILTIDESIEKLQDKLDEISKCFEEPVINFRKKREEIDYDDDDFLTGC